jgi:4-hydroxy-tetrahydrodipicolinate reductase
MNILLIGFGGMGRQVHSVALEHGHLVTVVDPRSEEANFKNLGDVTNLSEFDIAIDFSLGDFALENVEICAEAGLNIVLGSTGWYSQMDKIKKLVENSNIGLLWSSNFSIGVNVYFKIVEAAAKLVNKFDEYDIWGHEIHHFNKADSPSGTAKTLEKILLTEIDRKTKVVEDKLDRRPEPNELHFSSLRAGAVNFEHTIGFDSEADTITVKHAARNRKGYALGAIKAAQWLKGKRGFYSMEDFLNL